MWYGSQNFKPNSPLPVKCGDVLAVQEAAGEGPAAQEGARDVHPGQKGATLDRGASTKLENVQI